MKRVSDLELHKELLSSLSPTARFNYEEEQKTRAKRFAQRMNSANQKSAEYLNQKKQQNKEELLRAQIEARSEQTKKEQLEKQSREKMVVSADQNLYFEQLREKNRERHKNDPQPRLGSASSKIAAAALSPPDKGRYLKKDDEKKMEDIKSRLGQREELEQLRNKYRDKNVVAEQASRVPYFERVTSPVLKQLKRETAHKMLERKELFKPLDHEELRTHQHKIDKLVEERKKYMAIMLTQSNHNESRASERPSKANTSVGKLPDKKKLAQESKQRVDRLTESIKSLPQALPADLIKFKAESNQWKVSRDKRNELLKKKESYGNTIAKDRLDKFRARQASEANDKRAEDSSAQLSAGEGLQQSIQQTARLQVSESLPKLGNRYLKEAIEKYGTNIDDFFKGQKLGHGREKFNRAMHMSQLMKGRAVRAEEFTRAYTGTSKYEQHQLQEIGREVNENLIKSMEAKFVVIDYFDGLADPKNRQSKALPPLKIDTRAALNKQSLRSDTHRY